MRETRADTVRALLLALALHVLLFAMMFVGLWWTRTATPAAAAGAPVEAQLIDADALSAQMRQTLAERPEPAAPQPQELPEPVEEEVAPPPQPLPEPVPQDAPTPPQEQAQEFIPEPDEESQEEVVDTPSPTPSEEEKLQEEKRRQAQIDLTERKRQEEAERKRRLAEMEEMRRKQLADIRRRREEAARQAEAAREKLEKVREAREIAQAAETAGAEPASAPAAPGNRGTDTGLLARYQTALQQAIESKWVRPETVPLGVVCRIEIIQLPGGEVMSAQVSSPCPYDAAGRQSIEAAVMKAQPLPYAGFESVFRRELILNFKASD